MRAVAGVLAVLAALVACVPPASASDDWVRGLRVNAERLWNPLPPGARLAVRPLNADESGLPDALLRELEQAFATALLATAPPGGAVASRRDLGAAWEEAESFHGTSGARLLADAAVDAVVVPSALERRTGVALSAVLLAVSDGAVGAILATMPLTDLAVEVARFDVVSVDTGARHLGVALAEGLRAATDPQAAVAVRVVQTGQRSPVADWLAGMVSEHLGRRLAEPPLFVARPLRRMGEQASRDTVRLELEIWDQGDRVDVHASATMATGGAAAATVRVAASSVPAAFRPLTRDGGRVGRGLHQAVGTFTPMAPLDRREVLFAARVLARAALIDDATGDGAGRRDGGRGRDVVTALPRLARAIPHDEIWRDGPSRHDGAEQHLRARVRPVGGGAAPRLEAAVDRVLYRPSDPLAARVLVRGGRAYVAAYVLQADDTVVRIAPAGDAARRLEPETRIALPGPRDPAVSAAPMSGSEETVEALIVVASAVPFDAAALAPSVRASPDASLAAAVETSGFLDALADLDLARVSLSVLPYRVRRGD